jgi:hypothetical protein
MNAKDLDELLRLLEDADINELEITHKSSLDMTNQEWELFAIMENSLHDEAKLIQAPKSLQSSTMRKIMQERKATQMETDPYYKKSLIAYIGITSLTIIISYFTGKSSIPSKFAVPYDFFSKFGLSTATFYQKMTETTIKFPPFVYMSIFAVLMVIGLELIIKSRSLVKQR